MIERALRNKDLELSEWYEKVRHALSRLAKRHAMMNASREPDEEEAGPLPAPSSDGLDSLLTPNQRLWNQRILAARAARGGGGA